MKRCSSVMFSSWCFRTPRIASIDFTSAALPAARAGNWSNKERSLRPRLSPHLTPGVGEIGIGNPFGACGPLRAL